MLGQAEGGRFMVGGLSLALPQPAPRPGALMLGVRPEHASFGEASASSWPLKVAMLEMLGAERLVYGHLGGQADAAMFTLRIDGTLTPPKAGDTLHLHVEPRHVHWFDAQSGQRV
jgi:sn-glycerol 3-phosphate transport system ATP-binding protein